jgi:hypothetical protein
VTRRQSPGSRILLLGTFRAADRIAIGTTQWLCCRFVPGNSGGAAPECTGFPANASGVKESIHADERGR